MAKIGIIIIVFVGILIEAFLFLRSMEQSEFTTITFTSSDGITIVGNYYVPSGKPKGALLMLHMMPATKESWDHLATALKAHGIASLAIDLRGHGESVKIQNPKSKIQILDYRKFSDAEHQGSKLDVEEALRWLQKEKGFSLEHVSIIGASIGANLALQAIASHKEIRKCVALSPGLNYRGIEPKAFVGNLQTNQEVLYVTSRNDEDNTQMTQELYQATVSKKDINKFVFPLRSKIKIYTDAGHGTSMFEHANDLEPTVINFLTQ